MRPLLLAVLVTGCAPGAIDASGSSVCQLASIPDAEIGLEDVEVSWWQPQMPIFVAGHTEGASRVGVSVKTSVFGPNQTEVLAITGIGLDGASTYGSFAPSDEGNASGYMFFVMNEGYPLLMPGGFFRREGGLLRNTVSYLNGISESDFTAEVELGRAGGPCPPPPESWQAL